MNKPSDLYVSKLSDQRKALVSNWTKGHALDIYLRRERQTKYGDYRFTSVFLGRDKHVITVNENLEKDLFFFTLTHELAHYFCRKKYGRRKMKPHGVEWKFIFAELLVASAETYPEEMRVGIKEYAKKPRATLFSSKVTTDLFMKKEDNLYLEEISQGALFMLGKRKMKKREKRKMRYLCEDLQNKKLYLVSKNSVVERILRNE